MCSSVDPPRAGLSQKVVRRIIEAAPRRIVYVSCNPTTLAPNAAQLVAAGYRAARACARSTCSRRRRTSSAWRCWSACRASDARRHDPRPGAERRGAPRPRSGVRRGPRPRSALPGINGADMHQRRAVPGAARLVRPTSPASSWPARSWRSVPARAASRSGDRVMAIVGGGGQAELAVVHERVLMPVPAALDWAAAGGLSRGVHDRARRDLHAGRGCAPASGCSSTAPPAVSAPPRSSWRTPAGARVTRDRPQPGAARSGRRARRGRDRTGGLRSTHGPFDVILELVGAPNLPENVKALAHPRPDRRDRDRRRREGRAQPRRADGRSGGGSRPRRCVRRPLEDKALDGARARSARVLPLLASGAAERAGRAPRTR